MGGRLGRTDFINRLKKRTRGTPHRKHKKRGKRLQGKRSLMR